GMVSCSGSRYCPSTCVSVSSFSSGEALCCHGRRPLEQVDDRVQGTVLVVWQTPAFQPCVGGSPVTWSLSTCTRRLLPMPASPLNRTTCPGPSLTQCQRSRRKPTSCSRPTSGVRPRGPTTSSRLCAPLGRRTR